MNKQRTIELLDTACNLLVQLKSKFISLDIKTNNQIEALFNEIHYSDKLKAEQNDEVKDKYIQKKGRVQRTNKIMKDVLYYVNNRPKL